MEYNRNKNEQKVSLIGRTMFFGMWIGILGLLSLFFYDWQQKEFNPNTVVRSVQTNQGEAEVTLVANRQGQYIVSGFINNTKVVFLIDTGANDVSIPEHIAKKLTLPIGRKIQFETANGLATGYKTKLDSIRIGNIELKNISASINPNVKFDEVLLGMSFLKYIELRQKNKTLTLRY